MYTYKLKNVPLPLNLWLEEKSFFWVVWDLISVVSSEYVGRIYIYFWLFIYQFSEMLLLRAAKAASHLSYTITVTASHCVGRKGKTWDKEMLGWQLEFDLHGAFQAWEPKLVILTSWCAKMVYVLSSSITRSTACEIPLRWYFSSEWLS